MGWKFNSPPIWPQQELWCSDILMFCLGIRSPIDSGTIISITRISGIWCEYLDHITISFSWNSSHYKSNWIYININSVFIWAVILWRLDYSAPQKHCPWKMCDRTENFNWKLLIVLTSVKNLHPKQSTSSFWVFLLLELFSISFYISKK